MNNVIIGTAGHIDHGKTTLIKAITGRNTDRLKEEQKRGISIELGFSYFDLPNGRRAGIIDVPGHEKFIKNMLAGVSGIDIVLLVVAADEGMMPQTIEHLAILDLLDMKDGFIVITKADMVDEEWLELVKEDVKESVKGTFLEGKPVYSVSSVEREGIDEVIEEIQNVAENIEKKDLTDTPRLPIDRVFSIAGFGTIVTGTLLSGTFSVGEEVQIFPGDVKGRIRSLQVHDNDVEEAYAGQRVAINISGVKKDDIDRGQVVSYVDSAKDTMMLDTRVKLLGSVDRIIENRTRVRLYIGAKEVLCRMVILDKEALQAGDEAYCQLRLEEPIVAKRGDRFILRFYSPMFTIGGGYIIESNPSKKQRFNEEDIKELEIKDTGDTKEVISKIVLDQPMKFITVKELSKRTGILEENILKDIKELDKDNKLMVEELTKDTYLLHIDNYNEMKNIIYKDLEKFHKDYPLRLGKSKEEIRSQFLYDINSRVSDSFFDKMESENLIKKNNEYVSLQDFEVEYTDDQERILTDIMDRINKNGFNLERPEEILENINGSVKEKEEVFLSLVTRGDIIKINHETFIEKGLYQKAIDELKAYIDENTSIEVSEYRDLLGTNRRVAIALLEKFDEIKLTKREGNKRILFS